MRIIKLAWVGTRTDNAEPTVALFREVLGRRLELDRSGFWMLKLQDGRTNDPNTRPSGSPGSPAEPRLPAARRSRTARMPADTIGLPQRPTLTR